VRKGDASRRVIALSHIDFHAFADSLVRTIELKDIYTAGHSRRVADLAGLVARALKFDAESYDYLHIAGHLHDIGKVGIPDGILLKTGPLTAAEFSVMQHHAAIGSDVFAGIQGFGRMSEIIRHHHERFDGKGYPDGVKGDMISLEASILAIADSFDAMTTSRSYRVGMGVSRALEEVTQGRMHQFHPDAADAFLRAAETWPSEVEAIINSQDLRESMDLYTPFKSITRGDTAR
jgi:HD-GYP domain-containing protein (c-di-GMP phosphodiesterase class II)